MPNEFMEYQFVKLAMNHSDLACSTSGAAICLSFLFLNFSVDVNKWTIFIFAPGSSCNALER